MYNRYDWQPHCILLVINFPNKFVITYEARILRPSNTLVLIILKDKTVNQKVHVKSIYHKYLVPSTNYFIKPMLLWNGRKKYLLSFYICAIHNVLHAFLLEFCGWVPPLGTVFLWSSSKMIWNFDEAKPFCWPISGLHKRSVCARGVWVNPWLFLCHYILTNAENDQLVPLNKYC